MAPLYSGDPLRAARQLLADLLMLAWCGAWWVISDGVRDALRTWLAPVAESPQRLQDLSSQLTAVADAAESVPLLGSSLAGPLRGLGGDTTALATGTAAQVAGLDRAVGWLALGVLLVPVAIGALAWAPPRVRFVRRSLAVRGAAVAPGGLAAGGTAAALGAGGELLALRALTTQPVRRLRRIHPDPAAAWRHADGEVIEALAALELRDLGWRRARRTGRRA